MVMNSQNQKCDDAIALKYNKADSSDLLGEAWVMQK
jgi:hypothetical protein